MSELDAGRRADAPQAVVTSAIGRLRSAATAPRLPAGAEGFDEVFAEVFAHIAQSQAVEQVDTAATEEQSIVQPQQQEETGDNGESQDDARQSVDRDPIVKPFTEIEQQVNDADSVDDSADREVIQEVVVESDDQVETEVAPVEVEEIGTEVAEFQIDDKVIRQATDDQGDRGRDRRQGDSNAPEVATGPVESKTTARRDDQSHQAEDLTPVYSELDQEDAGQGEDDLGWSNRNRRVRGRHQSETSGGPNDSIGQSQSKQQDAFLRAVASQRSAAAQSASVADQIDPSTLGAATKPSTAHSPQVAAVTQSAAQAVARASSVASSSGNSGNGNQVRAATSLEQNTASPPAKDKPAAKPSKANTAETVSRVKLIQRVSKAFQHLGPEGGTVRLRLAPAEMGSVRVEMRIQQRKIQARVVAETEAASTALREHLPELRQRLESQGMQIERLDVEVDSGERDAADSRQQQSSGWQHSRSRQQTPAPTRPVTRRAESVEVAPEVSHSYQTVNPTSGVDIRL